MSNAGPLRTGSSPFLPEDGASLGCRLVRPGGMRRSLLRALCPVRRSARGKKCPWEEVSHEEKCPTPKEAGFTSSKPKGSLPPFVQGQRLVNRKRIPLVRQSSVHCSLRKGQCWVSLVTEYSQSMATAPGSPYVVCSSQIWFPLWWFQGLCIWI
uniref:Uncharacterized protein n=1 Tax=Pipistrellus kuhlii TaxID=59472 RepID=A0A7J8B258_PIPKU|nr:hypothetical protein mPipKuh1_007920 [Pipistrellus kuhlii]